ncbi:MAG: hypothetical protein FJ020_05975 [Chloroflexi bacterium]|nr:hypothetical protein [Chloroflexota bacterium]
MTTEFTHPQLGEEVRTLAGYYVPREEHLLPLDGREVLYIVGDACIEASCCGMASWSYVQVPGFFMGRRVQGGGAVPAVSEVETIESKETRNAVTESLLKLYPGARVEIW